jgi:hypothetical protein
MCDWLRAGRPGYRDSIPGRGEKIFPLSSCVQTGSGAHSASCPMGTEGKARPGRDADHSPHLVPRSGISRSYTSFPLSISVACSGTAFNKELNTIIFWTKCWPHLPHLYRQVRPHEQLYILNYCECETVWIWIYSLQMDSPMTRHVKLPTATFHVQYNFTYRHKQLKVPHLSLSPLYLSYSGSCETFKSVFL